ncbi:hypothetical protein [Enterobacter sp. C2]|uniref:hypothetical protein n=1 Tax=Enterobacter sp. C2 TaxID=2870346 RepID=UPI001CA4639D|nr:hypothetical protein [Enterobacter sp. C2]
MTERGMIFNAEMVRAIRDGRKTQTRRIIQSAAKNMQARGHEVISHRAPGDKWYGDYVYSMRDRSGVWQDFTNEQFLAKCPFGQPGDRIWVRETWADVNHDGCPAVAYRADGEVRDLHEDDGDEQDPNLEKYWFANWYPDLISGTEGNWTPSIHMPRWASRITLEITDVRVERLNSISDTDANAEGVSADRLSPARYVFGSLWQSIYGADNPQSWQANPWVWVIEFKRVDGGTA